MGFRTQTNDELIKQAIELMTGTMVDSDLPDGELYAAVVDPPGLHVMSSRCVGCSREAFLAAVKELAKGCGAGCVVVAECNRVIVETPDKVSVINGDEKEWERLLTVS